MGFKKKFIFYWDGIVEGDIVEKLRLNRFSNYILATILIILLFIAMGIYFQRCMVHQNESRKKLEETSIIYKETLYKKEKSESLNAIMTKLEETGSKLYFPQKPAINLTEEPQK